MVNYENFDTSNMKFKLTSDIDLTGKYWIPIGSAEIQGDLLNAQNAFSGVFDGNGYTIFNINTYDYLENGAGQDFIGLFGFVQNAEIKNLQIKDAHMSGRKNVGIFAGAMDNSIVSNLKILSGEVKGKRSVGSVVGYGTNESLISKVTVFANVQASESLAGGIIGSANNSSIENNVTFGSVTSAGIVGGVAGEVLGRAGIVGNTCRGSITGEIVGAIVGKIGAIGQVNNINVSSNANYGALNSSNKIGTIAGLVENGENDNVILMYNSSVSQNSSGNVDFVASTFTGTIIACYFQADSTSGSVKVAYGSEEDFDQGFRYKDGTNNSLPMQVEIFEITSSIEKQNDVLSFALSGFIVR